MENVNKCPKNINLGTIYRNVFIYKNDKTINFFVTFLYF